MGLSSLALEHSASWELLCNCKVLASYASAPCTFLRTGRTLARPQNTAPTGLSQDQEMYKDIGDCYLLSAPGPHVLLLVTELGRFTAQDTMAVRRVKEVFGAGAMRHVVVLFTHKEDLGSGSLDEFVINTDNHSLRILIQECGRRYCGFNNWATREEQREQLEELMAVVENLERDNWGNFYTNDLFCNAQMSQGGRDSTPEEHRPLGSMCAQVQSSLGGWDACYGGGGAWRELQEGGRAGTKAKGGYDRRIVLSSHSDYHVHQKVQMLSYVILGHVQWEFRTTRVSLKSSDTKTCDCHGLVFQGATEQGSPRRRSPAHKADTSRRLVRTQRPRHLGKQSFPRLGSWLLTQTRTLQPLGTENCYHSFRQTNKNPDFPADFRESKSLSPSSQALIAP
ncbi:hypothetical protein QTO34_004821 [Cnephaeus nilssonii]|uniref:AIG1-type G domain-containing protein n=1 Tax=Cnephaeus nilssonii TaxID=3371016 RepID=A0AA40LK76_CNENI|nr:hypothetical protein QTO34_004821 [Eptesicus nilssonii]